MENSVGQVKRNLEEENGILLEAHNELLRQLAEKDAEASFDSLTGLMRRGPFVQEVESHLFNPKIPLVSLIIFDIDHFKDVNDTLGHNVGDVVLKEVAGVVGRYVRRYDPACRWGGEEMALAMIGADEKTAAVKANFIREKISQIEFPKFPDLKITVSAGVASSDKFKKFDELFNAADKAMYESKNNGRNRVTAYSKLSEGTNV